MAILFCQGWRANCLTFTQKFDYKNVEVFTYPYNVNIEGKGWVLAYGMHLLTRELDREQQRIVFYIGRYNPPSSRVRYDVGYYDETLIIDLHGHCDIETALSITYDCLLSLDSIKLQLSNIRNTDTTEISFLKFNSRKPLAPNETTKKILQKKIYRAWFENRSENKKLDYYYSNNTYYFYEPVARSETGAFNEVKGALRFSLKDFVTYIQYNKDYLFITPSNNIFHYSVEEKKMSGPYSLGPAPNFWLSRLQADETEDTLFIYTRWGGAWTGYKRFTIHFDKKNKILTNNYPELLLQSLLIYIHKYYSHSDKPEERSKLPELCFLLTILLLNTTAIVATVKNRKRT